MAKRNARIAVDAALTVLMVFEMLIQFTGQFLHEVAGFAFFATVLLHLLLSSKWIAGTAEAARKGKLATKRRRFAMIAGLLGATMGVLGASSVMVSDILWDAGLTWELGPYEMWEAMHAVSSYALCALVTVHLAMHWGFLFTAMRVPYDPSRRSAIGASVHTAAAFIAVGFGVAAARSGIPQQVAGTSVATASTAVAPEGRAMAVVRDAVAPADPAGAETIRKSGVKTITDETVAQGAVAGDDYTENVGQDVDTGVSWMYSDGGAYEAPADWDAADDQGYVEQDDYVDSYVDAEPEYTWYEEPTYYGNCTLCRKGCSLGNPGCNKPYEAGLI